MALADTLVIGKLKLRILNMKKSSWHTQEPEVWYLQAKGVYPAKGVLPFSDSMALCRRDANELRAR